MINKCYRVWFNEAAMLVDAKDEQEAQEKATQLSDEQAGGNRGNHVTKVECLSDA